jgi:fructosamine-3-kinase
MQLPPKQERGRLVYVLDNYLALKTQYEAIADVDERVAFLARQRKTLIEMNKVRVSVDIHPDKAHNFQHATLCENWASAQAECRLEELREIKSTRKKEYENLGDMVSSIADELNQHH